MKKVLPPNFVCDMKIQWSLGKTDQEIAYALKVSIPTVGKYRNLEGLRPNIKNQKSPTPFHSQNLPYAKVVKKFIKDGIEMTFCSPGFARNALRWTTTTYE